MILFNYSQYNHILWNYKLQNINFNLDYTQGINPKTEIHLIGKAMPLHYILIKSFCY